MWLQDLVAKFGPVTERADNTTVLDFERPLAELDSRIREVSLKKSEEKTKRGAIIILAFVRFCFALKVETTSPGSPHWAWHTSIARERNE